MKKIHSRAKRKLGLGTHTTHRYKLLGLRKKTRPKTFRTEEAAKKHAEESKIKNYELKKIKKRKKFQIVEKA